MKLSKRQSIALGHKLAGSATGLELRFLSVSLEKGQALEPAVRLAGPRKDLSDDTRGA